MNKLSDSPLRKFNPGTLQSDQTVIKQFVVRERELGIVLDVLKGNIDSPSCQHILVVAPRGRGKSMLLARVVAELRTDKALAARLFPIRFMEESQEIFTIADFWLEALFHLARELATSEPELSRELQATHAALVGRWQEENLGTHVLATVLDAADRLGKQLVIMVENLQALCEDTDDDFGWQLRKTLQAENKIMLLATATSHFSGLDDAQQPFFELFQLICLQPLDTEECRRLWQAVTGEAVSARAIKPLQILTGGSPRLLIIMADFARHRSLRQLMEELVNLIDDHTEYFRSHLETLAKNERRVYIAVIDLWQPSMTGEIAARARMDVRKVSALLGRLANRGAITVEGSGKKQLYVAAERLYSIYYKLRRERDEAAVVSNLIHFMTVFYNSSEWADWSKNLAVEAENSPGIRAGIERAIAESSQANEMFGEFLSNADYSIAPKTNAAHKELDSLFSVIRAAYEDQAYEKVIEIVEQNSDLTGADYAHALLWKAVAQGLLSELTAAIATCDEVINCFGASNNRELQVLVANALVNKGVSQCELGESAAAVATYNEVITRFSDSDDRELQALVARALFNRSVSQGELGESAAAIATYNEVITHFSNSDDLELQALVAWALFNKGVSQAKLGESAEAIVTYNEVITRFGDSDDRELQMWVARVLVNKGFMQGELGNSAAAIATYDEMNARFGDSDDRELQVLVAMALVNNGVRQIVVGDSEDVLYTAKALERDFGTLVDDESIPFKWYASWMEAHALIDLKKPSDAMPVIESLFASFDPSNPTMMRIFQQVIPELIEMGASAEAISKILTSDAEKCATITPLIVSIRQEAGETVRAPAEVLEVAADIRQRMKARREVSDTIF